MSSLAPRVHALELNKILIENLRTASQNLPKVIIRLPFCFKLKSLPTFAFENTKKYFLTNRSVKMNAKL